VVTQQPYLPFFSTYAWGTELVTMDSNIDENQHKPETKTSCLSQNRRTGLFGLSKTVGLILIFQKFEKFCDKKYVKKDPKT
jgi:hypothetical protein